MESVLLKRHLLCFSDWFSATLTFALYSLSWNKSVGSVIWLQRKACHVTLQSEPRLKMQMHISFPSTPQFPFEKMLKQGLRIGLFCQKFFFQSSYLKASQAWYGIQKSIYQWKAELNPLCHFQFAQNHQVTTGACDRKTTKLTNSIDESFKFTKSPTTEFQVNLLSGEVCPLFGVLLTCQFISNLASVGSVENH